MLLEEEGWVWAEVCKGNNDKNISHTHGARLLKTCVLGGYPDGLCKEVKDAALQGCSLFNISQRIRLTRPLGIRERVCNLTQTAGNNLRVLFLLFPFPQAVPVCLPLNLDKNYELLYLAEQFVGVVLYLKFRLPEITR